MLVIGSNALKFNNNLSSVEPRDWDIIGTIGDVLVLCKRFNWEITEVVESTSEKFVVKTTGLPIECELITTEHGWDMWIEGNLDSKYDPASDLMYASNDFLLLLKTSHRYKKNSVHFLKTMKDIHFLRSKGAVIHDYQLLKERERITYTYGHPKLNVSKSDFFNGDGVNYVYDHDDLHRIFAVDGQPAYTKYLKEGSEVLTSKEKFFACDKRTQTLGGLEEAMVLSAERSFIPFGFKTNRDKIFKYALDKVCTSITSGYFREACWESYWDIVKIYKEEVREIWVEKLQNEIQAGTIRKFSK